MVIVIESDSVALSYKGAALFSRSAVENVASRGRFVVALSGGATPRAMHRLLCEAPRLAAIPWNKTHIFWVDERCVSMNDPASNYGTARADFLDRVPIPQNQIHPMPAEFSPKEGADAYSEELIRFFQTKASEMPVFDLIILGIGMDGHTASLFPGESALNEEKRMIVSTTGGNPHVARLTMTLPLLNTSREVIFLVSGGDKAPIMKAVLEGPPARFPAQMIQPVSGNLTWLMDRDAASELRR